MNSKCAGDPARDVDHLLNALCVEWGFCTKLTAKQVFQAHATLTDELFARAVLEAEGMSPDLNPAWLARIKERFLERCGPTLSREPGQQ